MPYFIVIPVFFAFVVLCLGAIAIAYARPEWKRWVPALAWGLLGATLGAIALNVLTVMLWVLCAQFVGEGAAGSAIAIFVAFLLFVGPFIATSVGALAGYAAGFAMRKPSRTPA